MVENMDSEATANSNGASGGGHVDHWVSGVARNSAGHTGPHEGAAVVHPHWKETDVLEDDPPYLYLAPPWATRSYVYVNHWSFQLLCLLTAIAHSAIYMVDIFVDLTQDHRDIFATTMVGATGILFITLTVAEVIIRVRQEAGAFTVQTLRTIQRMLGPHYHKLEAVTLGIVVCRTILSIVVVVYSIDGEGYVLKDFKRDKATVGFTIVYRVMRVWAIVYGISVQTTEKELYEEAHRKKVWMKEHTEMMEAYGRRRIVRIEAIFNKMVLQIIVTLSLTTYTVVYAMTSSRDSTIHKYFWVTEPSGYVLSFTVILEFFIRVAAQEGQMFFRITWHRVESFLAVVGCGMLGIQTWNHRSIAAGTASITPWGSVVALFTLGQRILRIVGILMQVSASQFDADGVMGAKAMKIVQTRFGDIVEVPPENIKLIFQFGQNIEVEIHKAVLKPAAFENLHLPFVLKGALIEDFSVTIPTAAPFKGGAPPATMVRLRNLLVIAGPGDGLGTVRGQNAETYGKYAGDPNYWNYDNIVKVKSNLVETICKRLSAPQQHQAEAAHAGDRDGLGGMMKLKSGMDDFKKRFVGKAKRVALAHVEVDIRHMTVQFEDSDNKLGLGKGLLIGARVGKMQLFRKEHQKLSFQILRMSAFCERGREVTTRGDLDALRGHELRGKFDESGNLKKGINASWPTKGWPSRGHFSNPVTNIVEQRKAVRDWLQLEKKLAWERPSWKTELLSILLDVGPKEAVELLNYQEAARHIREAVAEKIRDFRPRTGRQYHYHMENWWDIGTMFSLTRAQFDTVDLNHEDKGKGMPRLFSPDGDQDMVPTESTTLRKLSKDVQKHDAQWLYTAKSLPVRIAIDEAQAYCMKSIHTRFKAWKLQDGAFSWRPDLRPLETGPMDSSRTFKNETVTVVKLWWMYAVHRVLAQYCQTKPKFPWLGVAYHGSNYVRYKNFLKEVALRGQAKPDPKWKKVLPWRRAPISRDPWFKAIEVGDKVEVCGAFICRKFGRMGGESPLQLGLGKIGAVKEIRDDGDVDVQFRRLVRVRRCDLDKLEKKELQVAQKVFQLLPWERRCIQELQVRIELKEILNCRKTALNILCVSNKSRQKEAIAKGLPVSSSKPSMTWLSRHFTSSDVEAAVDKKEKKKIIIRRPGASPNTKAENVLHSVVGKWAVDIQYVEVRVMRMSDSIPRPLLLHKKLCGFRLDAEFDIKEAPARDLSHSFDEGLLSFDMFDKKPIARAAVTISLADVLVVCPEAHHGDKLLDFGAGSHIVNITRFIQTDKPMDAEHNLLPGAQAGKDVAFCVRGALTSRNAGVCEVHLPDVRVVVYEPLILALTCLHKKKPREAMNKDELKVDAEKEERRKARGQKGADVESFLETVQENTKRVMVQQGRKGPLRQSIVYRTDFAGMSEIRQILQDRLAALTEQSMLMNRRRRRATIFEKLTGVTGLHQDVSINVSVGAMDCMQVGALSKHQILVESFRCRPFCGRGLRAPPSGPPPGMPPEAQLSRRKQIAAANAKVEKRLVIRLGIEGATGLRNADLLSKSDPFCTIEIEDMAGEIGETDVIDDTLDPVWHYETTITDYPVGRGLVFKVWDDDARQAESLGVAELKFQAFLPDGVQDFHYLPLKINGLPALKHLDPAGDLYLVGNNQLELKMASLAYCNSKNIADLSARDGQPWGTTVRGIVEQSEDEDGVEWLAVEARHYARHAFELPIDDDEPKTKPKLNCWVEVFLVPRPGPPMERQVVMQNDSFREDDVMGFTDDRWPLPLHTATVNARRMPATEPQKKKQSSYAAEYEASLGVTEVCSCNSWQVKDPLAGALCDGDNMGPVVETSDKSDELYTQEPASGSAAPWQWQWWYGRSKCPACFSSESRPSYYKRMSREPECEALDEEREHFQGAAPADVEETPSRATSPIMSSRLPKAIPTQQFLELMPSFEGSVASHPRHEVEQGYLWRESAHWRANLLEDKEETMNDILGGDGKADSKAFYRRSQDTMFRTSVVAKQAKAASLEKRTDGMNGMKVQVGSVPIVFSAPDSPPAKSARPSDG